MFKVLEIFKLTIELLEKKAEKGLDAKHSIILAELKRIVQEWEILKDEVIDDEINDLIFNK